MSHTYSCRVDENVTVSYRDGVVTITHTDNYWGRDESSSVPIKNIGMLIRALQDIQKTKYDGW